LTLYEKFEHTAVLTLILLIAVIIVAAVWTPTLAAATLSLGSVYWLVRDQDRRGHR
jgi:hypothetical protein